MKQLFINTERLETRLAVLNDGVLQEYEIERNTEKNLKSYIFKGIVRNLEDSLQAAFLDIGIKKNAFLHYWDILFDSNLEETIGEHSSEKKTKVKKQDYSDIAKRVPIGSELVVQISKGPIGSKGPRVTTHLGISGQFLVLVPNNSGILISKKIVSNKERTAFKKMIEKFDLPNNVGIIFRTIAQGQEEEFLYNDLVELLERWEGLKEKMKSNGPICLYPTPGIVNQAVNALFSDYSKIEEIVVDNIETYNAVEKQLIQYSNISLDKLKLYNQATHIFDKFNISKQIKKIFEREVKLTSGGYLCIDETEALIAIDINSGKNTLGKDHPETILNTNIEAALEIAKQIRLRDIGGLIVIDFIDMKSRVHQDRVYQTLKKELVKDKAKAKILKISSLGLLEMTRQRESQSLKDSIFSQCSYCHGKGVIKSFESMNVEIQRHIVNTIKKQKNIKKIQITLNSKVLLKLRESDTQVFDDIEHKYEVSLRFRADGSYHMEEYNVTDVS